MSYKQDSYALIMPYDHGSYSKNFHSIDHFPTSVPEDGCFTPIAISHRNFQILFK